MPGSHDTEDFGVGPQKRILGLNRMLHVWKQEVERIPELKHRWTLGWTFGVLMGLKSEMELCSRKGWKRFMYPSDYFWLRGMKP